MKLKKRFNLFSSSEELISMFLGLVIVVVVVGLMFSFFQKRKGITNVPGVTISQGDEDSNINRDSSSKEYIVKKGDNLWKIAVATYGNGYKWTEIAKENKLDNPGLLEKDQKLVLPVIEKKEIVASVTKVLTEQKEYTVVKGDNLWKICIANYNDGYKWTNVWQANKKVIMNPSNLEIGMKLILPVLN